MKYNKIIEIIDENKNLDSYIYDSHRRELTIFYIGHSIKYEWMQEIKKELPRYVSLLFVSITTKNKAAFAV